MTPPPGETPLATRIIQNEAEWDAIRGPWDDLYACSATASTPLDYRWLRIWWRVYRPALRNASLRIVTIWRGPTLVGALPLYVDHGQGFRVRRLRFLSTGEAEFEETCPDYLNLLSLPGEEAACARLMWSEIHRLTWDHLELINLAGSSPLLAPAAVRMDARRTTATCPVADLSGGFEAYLQRLSPSARQRARRLLRDATCAGVRFEIAPGHQCGAVFDELMRLHQARWRGKSKPGVFGADRFVEFHRRLVAEWVPSGRAVLARLSVDSDPVAVVYGFVLGSRFDFYQSGVDTEKSGPLQSAGNLCHLLLMKALGDRGVDAYDFLSGTAAYKKRLATGENHICSIEIWNSSIRAAAWRSARFVGRALKAGYSRHVRRPVDVCLGEHGTPEHARQKSATRSYRD